MPMGAPRRPPLHPTICKSDKNEVLSSCPRRGSGRRLNADFGTKVSTIWTLLAGHRNKYMYLDLSLNLTYVQTYACNDLEQRNLITKLSDTSWSKSNDLEQRDLITKLSGSSWSKSLIHKFQGNNSNLPSYSTKMQTKSLGSFCRCIQLTLVPCGIPWQG
jgi:hypothetical protein